MIRFPLLASGAALCAALVLTAAPSPDDSAPAPRPDSPAFAKLKSLLGEWANESEGKTLKITYSLASAGRCVKESIPMGDHAMESFFCADGNAIVMTHYCGAGNQPRMKAAGVGKDGSLRFDFLDITGLASPATGYMHDLKIAFLDADHIENTWTYLEKGKKSPMIFKLTRVPPAVK